MHGRWVCALAWVCHVVGASEREVAVCVSGGLRTLALGTVATALRRDVIDPLQADAFLYLGVHSLETMQHCLHGHAKTQEPSKETVARYLGDADFASTVRRTLAVVRPVSTKLVGCASGRSLPE